MSDTWQVAQPTDRETRLQIYAQFVHLYKMAGRPEGAALFEATDSEGEPSALCLNPAAARRFPELFSRFTPWIEVNGRPAFNMGVIAGDERANPDPAYRPLRVVMNE